VAAVLINDPDPATRSLLELVIERLGHRPIGSRAWLDGDEPDLVLLEPVSRPGVRLVRGLRRRLPHVPVLCVSIDGPNGESLSLEPVAHVMKPFRRSQLERAVEEALVASADVV
jgi:two-component SAPR family response regulator